MCQAQDGGGGGGGGGGGRNRRGEASGIFRCTFAPIRGPQRVSAS